MDKLLSNTISFLVGVAITGCLIMWSIGFEREQELSHLKDLQNQAKDEVNNCKKEKSRKLKWFEEIR